ncbi:MAG: DUF4421 domain-containing protein, partial [Chitinophagaceae bacterium]
MKFFHKIGLLLLPVFGFSQADSLASPYFESYDEKISTHIFILNKLNSFSLYFPADDLTLEMSPNAETTLNIGVNYDIVSFSFGYAPKFFRNNDPADKSRMLAFQFSLFPKRFAQHAEFYYQKGMNLEVTGTDASVYLPNMKTLKIGGSTAYVFNPDYSFRATQFQNARQIKSAGTFAPGIAYYYTELNGRKELDMGEKIWFADFAIFPAYHYNWVIAKYVQAMGGLALGPGLTVTRDDQTDVSFLLYGNLNLGLGYNSNTWYGGVNARAQIATHDAANQVAIGDYIGYFSAFVGYRFDAPEFVSKTMSDLKRRNPLQKKA